MSKWQTRARGGLAACVETLSAALVSPECWRVVLGVACGLASVALMNSALFPLFDAVFTYARDISITFEALVLVAIAVTAMWRPSVVKARPWTVIVLTGCITGFILVALAVSGAGPVLLVVGACLCVTSRAASTISVNMAAVSLSVPQMTVSVLLGTLVSYPLQWSLGLMPAWVGAVLAVVVLPLAMLALCAGAAGRLMDDVAASPAVADVSVTRPASFLPLTHTLYVFQFVMFVGYGFALRFGEVKGSPTFGLVLVAVSVVCLLLAVVVRGGLMPYDTVCNIAVLVLLAGFMLAIVSAEGGAYRANTVLVVGNALYGALITVTMVALAGRNRAASLSILCWANGLAALGTTLGALVGTTANRMLGQGAGLSFAYMLAAVTVLLMGYILFFLRGFSFADTIRGVGSPADIPNAVTTQSPSDEELFERSCEAIAGEYALTPREAQTFRMLARGRDREYIEGELGVSRNTVKAHVKHVYAKLEIHSHIELLDLVMRQMRSQQVAD